MNEEENEQIEELELESTEKIVEESVVEVEVETGEPTETEETSEEEEPRQSKSQGTKQRLRRKLREAEQREAVLLEETRISKERLDTLETKLEGVINPVVRPARVDFETEEDYEDALFDYRDRSTKTPEPKPQAQRPVVAIEVRQNWDTQLDKGHEAHADFQEVINNPNLNMTDPMAHAVMGSDYGSEIAYHLGKNPQEADRIARLDMASQVREIDKLGNKFKPTTTNTPAPITPTKSGDSPTKDIENMSMTEFAAYRNKQQYG